MPCCVRCQMPQPDDDGRDVRLFKDTTMIKPSPISPTIPLDQDGIHHGFLKLPYSRDDSAWGAVMIPITVVRNGSGRRPF